MSAIFCDTRSSAVAIVNLSDEQREQIKEAIIDTWNARNCDDEWDYSAGLVDCNVPPHEAQHVHDIMHQRDADYYLSTEVYYGDLRLVAPLEDVAAYLVDVTVQWAMAHYSEDGSDADEMIDGILDAHYAIDEALRAREVVTFDPTRDYAGCDEWLHERLGQPEYKRVCEGLKIAKELRVDDLSWTCESLRNLYLVDDKNDPQCLRLYRAKMLPLIDPSHGWNGCQYNEYLRNAWSYFIDDLADACLEERCRLQHLEEEGQLDEDDDIDDLVENFRCSTERQAEELREDTQLDWT